MDTGKGEPSGRRDLFDALADPLRERIRTGELAPGALLPSESALAHAADTKRYSIRRALSRLHDQGMIEPVAGRGWVVVDPDAGPSTTGDGLPRYRRIAAELREAIKAGQLAAGSALPSETDLIKRYGVSRGTVRHALALLEADGVISARPGKGRYVR